MLRYKSDVHMGLWYNATDYGIELQIDQQREMYRWGDLEELIGTLVEKDLAAEVTRVTRAKRLMDHNESLDLDMKNKLAEELHITYGQLQAKIQKGELQHASAVSGL